MLGIPSIRRWTKYWSSAKTQLLHNMAYPLDLALHSLNIVFFMWIFAHLWRVVYETEGTMAISGLSLRDTLWYLMVAETIVLSRPRMSREMSAAVKDGSIAYLLNRPYSFLGYHLSKGLGDTAMRAVGNAVAGGAVVWYMVGPPSPSFGWALVPILICAAWLIDFFLSALIGLLAFVTEDVSGFDWVYSKLTLLLGGLLFPLDFFPEWLRGIALLTPFAYTVYGPSRCFVDPAGWRLSEVFTGQLVWILALGLIVLISYRRSVRRLGVNGG